MRTSADRSSELMSIFEERFSSRLRRDFTGDVTAAYDRCPLGPHDDKTARVVRALGNASANGKEIILNLGPNGPWGIGRITLGAPGNLLLLPGTFHSYEDALRRVFSLRRKNFLES
ncbi:hypothetical protein KNN17_06600 [Arthrobacter bambusae]|jgi:hypothetical protein|uniref:hypothetical protein n=1 Tax=Arthrobacter TaxID=1663 RepID=UPI001F509570|nr:MULTISPECIES: hypothetical protein [Arthrobacter]MCI0141244.1 hypothetical protein [Arthrobacter bambusae]UYY82099.1 hypothetical protein OIT41_03300 [Arthrobacter sp. YA7-1]